MEIVTFEIAKKLKEKSFPQKTDGRYSMIDCFYYEDGRLFFHGGACDVNEAYTAPTISQVLKWLRDEKKLYVEPCILADADTDADGKVINEYIYWSFSITDIETGDMIYFEYEQHIDDKRFDSYEEAALAGIEVNTQD